uniref:Uncharacterized protein n=1 Tax=Anguilla anguilla TaxID=7936 RepID=A0A0E9QSR8_ANGAN
MYNKYIREGGESVASLSREAGAWGKATAIRSSERHSLGGCLSWLRF